MFFSCSHQIEYSDEHIKSTSGSYLYNQDEVIDVFYEDNDLFLLWKNGKFKPVVLDETTFFVADMYQKLRFATEPKTNDRYLAIVSEEDDNEITYAYPKMADGYKTPRMYLRNKDYDKALAGYTELFQKDSIKSYISENEVNRMGYKLLRSNDYDNAITVFKLNVLLYPNSDNSYDSLADAYLKTGDSLEAYNNYKIAVLLNSGNQRAKAFLEHYSKQ